MKNRLKRLLLHINFLFRYVFKLNKLQHNMLPANEIK